MFDGLAAVAGEAGAEISPISATARNERRDRAVTAWLPPLSRGGHTELTAARRDLKVVVKNSFVDVEDSEASFASPRRRFCRSLSDTVINYSCCLDSDFSDDGDDGLRAEGYIGKAYGQNKKRGGDATPSDVSDLGRLDSSPCSDPELQSWDSNSEAYRESRGNSSFSGAVPSLGAAAHIDNSTSEGGWMPVIVAWMPWPMPFDGLWGEQAQMMTEPMLQDSVDNGCSEVHGRSGQRWNVGGSCSEGSKLRAGGFPRAAVSRVATAYLVDQAVAEVRAQLVEQGGVQCRVWIPDWRERFGRSLGSLKRFLQSQPHSFVITEGLSRKFKVSLAEAVSAPFQPSHVLTRHSNVSRLAPSRKCDSTTSSFGEDNQREEWPELSRKPSLTSALLVKALPGRKQPCDNGQDWPNPQSRLAVAPSLSSVAATESAPQLASYDVDSISLPTSSVRSQPECFSAPEKIIHPSAATQETTATFEKSAGPKQSHPGQSCNKVTQPKTYDASPVDVPHVLLACDANPLNEVDDWTTFELDGACGASPAVADVTPSTQPTRRVLPLAPKGPPPVVPMAKSSGAPQLLPVSTSLPHVPPLLMTIDAAQSASVLVPVLSLGRPKEIVVAEKRRATTEITLAISPSGLSPAVGPSVFGGKLKSNTSSPDVVSAIAAAPILRSKVAVAPEPSGSAFSAPSRRSSAKPPSAVAAQATGHGTASAAVKKPSEVRAAAAESVPELVETAQSASKKAQAITPAAQRPAQRTLEVPNAVVLPEVSNARRRKARVVPSANHSEDDNSKARCSSGFATSSSLAFEDAGPSRSAVLQCIALLLLLPLVGTAAHVAYGSALGGLARTGASRKTTYILESRLGSSHAWSTGPAALAVDAPRLHQRSSVISAVLALDVEVARARSAGQQLLVEVALSRAAQRQRVQEKRFQKQMEQQRRYEEMHREQYEAWQEANYKMHAEYRHFAQMQQTMAGVYTQTRPGF